MNAPLHAAAAPDDTEQARADMYALLAALLLRPPSAALLAGLAQAGLLQPAQDGQALAASWAALLAAAGSASAAAVAQQFDALFISVGTPRVNPHGSYYLAGFLMEKPLAALRDDLFALGLGRSDGSRELEDHLGALCETMRLLIAGAPTLPARSLAEQRTFFLKHIAPWYRRCADDLRAVDGAPFYQQVADFSQAFLDTEFEAFGFEDAPDASIHAEPSSTENTDATSLLS